MANEWSQDLLDELNSAGQEFESAALSGDSSIPDNVRETVAENVLYRYYQEQKKAEATKNGIGTSAKLLNNMKQGNPWRPTGADFAYAQTGYDENGKPLSAQDWSTKLQTDKEEADKKVSELQQKLSTLEANRDANSYLQGTPSLYALVQDKLPNGSLEEINNTKKALEEAQAQQGKIQKAMEYANAAKTNSEYQDQLEKLRKEEGKNYLEIYAESGQKIENLNEMLKDYNQRLEDTKKTYGRLWDATEEGKTYSKMVDDINAQLEKEMGFRSFTESYLNPADDKNADAIIQQGKELAQLMEANQQAAGRAVLQERDPDAGISTYTQYRAATREGTHVREDWPEEQKNNYYYLLGKFGEKAAEDYAVRVNTELNQTALQAGTKKAQEFGAQEKGNLAQKIGAGVAGLALSAGTPIFHAMSYIDKMSAVASGVPYTGRNFALPSDQVNAMVQGRASQINKDYGTLPSTIPVVGGKGWGDLYQLGQSVVQSLVLGNTVGEVGTLAAFFAQAGDTAFDEAKARGGSDEYAAAVSVLAGAAEAAGEKIGLDHLFNGGADLAKGLGTYLVNQSLIEGAEEGVTDILNLFGDQLASRMTGNETKMQQDVRALTAQGMDKKEAEREVWKRFVNDTAFDMVGGFISGAVSAGVQGPASIENQVSNKLWDMRKDSVLGKQNAEGKREGGKADVSADELEKMIDRALKRGDLAGAEELMRRLDEKTGNAEEQEYGPADPRANEKMRGRLERQLNGERVNPQAEETEPQEKPEVNTPPALPEEFKDLNPVVAEQFATYEGRDLERITRSMLSQEAYRYEEYLRSIGQNEKADLIDRYRIDPTFHYEEKAPHPADDPNLQNGPETGTIAAPNTQEVNNNAGEQTVRQPEAEAADFGVGRRPAGAGAAASQRGASENAQKADERRARSNAESLPRFVSQEDLNELSDNEESAPISKEQKAEYKSLTPLTNDGIQVVSKPQIGSRLHLAWSLAKKLGQKVLFARNYNGSVFKDGSTAYQNGGDAIIDADSTQMELATAVAHEAGHAHYFAKFGAFSDILNGAYTKRLNFFTGVFNDAFGVMKGLQAMRTTEKYIRDDRGYEKKYAKSRARYIRETNARITNQLTQNATKMVAEMEKARAVEEFMNQVLAWDELFIKDFARATGLSYDDVALLRKALIASLESNGIFTAEEIQAINDAIDALEDGGFTDDISDEEEFGSFEAVDTDADAADFNSDLGRAVRKAAAGETSSMSDDELLAVLNYALDRAVPSSKGGSITARLSELYDEYVKSATSYIPEFGYRGRRIGTLSEGSAKSLMRTVSTAIGELSDRGIKFSSPDDSITDFANMFGAIADKNGNPVDMAYSEKEEDTREYDDGKGVMATEDEWYEKNAPRIKRDMQRGNDVVESFNSYQQNGTRRRDVPVSQAKTTQQVNGREVVDTSWIKPVEVSQKEVTRARDAVYAKDKIKEYKAKKALLQAHLDYYASVVNAMREAREATYEQNVADLGYLADNIKEELSWLDEDMDKVASGIIGVEEESVIDDIAIEKGNLNVQLDALRDEYKHLDKNDPDSYRTIRKQIDDVLSQINVLNVRINNLSKRAAAADWGSNKRTLFQAEMAENPASETEEPVSRPPINEPGYNKYVHELSYEERAEERLRRAKDAAKKEADRLRNRDFYSELRARTNEYQIVRNETDRSLNNKRNVPGYPLDVDAKGKTGVEKLPVSDAVRQKNLETYQEAMRPGRLLKVNDADAKSMDRLNRMFAERLGIENKGSTAIAYSNRQQAEAELDVDADAADFGEPTRGMGTGYVGMQTSRNKDGGLEFHTMYDDVLPTRPATDKTRKPLKATSTAYSSVSQAARSILNSKSSFLDFSKSRPKDIPSNVTKAMGQLREHVREMMEGEHPVNALMQISNMIHEFANDDDLKIFSSASIQKAADELNDIYYNQNITNEEKAKRMVENATKTLSLISKRVQLVDRGYHMLKTFTGPRKKRDGTTYWSQFKAMQLNPATLFRAMDGFDRRGAGSGYKIAKMIENGTALYTITQTQALQKFSEIAGLEGYKEFVEGNAKPFDIDGVQITEQQAVEFIMQVRNLMNTEVTGKDGPTNRLNTIDGFSIKDKNGKNVFVEMSHEDDGPNVEWFQNLAEGMENSLSPAAKKYLETATEILDDLGQQASDIRTNLIGTGFDGSINGTYYPITYDNKNGTTYSQQEQTASLADGPMYQSRTRNVGGYVSIKNASDTMDKYIHWASNFIGYGEVAELLYAMDNTGSRVQNLTSLADDMLGKGYSENIGKFVKDINEIPDGEKNSNSTLAMLRKNMASGALLGNLGVAAKQYASLWSAGSVLSPQAILSVAWFGKHSDADNMLLQSRKTGTSLDPTISEILHNDSFMGKLMKRSGVSKIMGKATAFVDYRTVRRLFAATVVDTKLSFPGMDQNSELFARTVEAKFQDVVLQTQPIFVKNARAGYMRSNNELMKALAMFRTQPTQNLNAIVTAIGEYNALKGTDLGKAAGKKLRNTIIGQTASAVTFAALSSVVSFARHGLKKFRDDDDELSFAEVAKRIGLDTLESLAGISLFGGDVAKAIITMATGGEEKEFYDLNAGVLSMIADTVSSVTTFGTNLVKAIREDKPLAVFNAGRQAVDNILQVGAGIPANTVYRLLNSFTMYTADAMYALSDGKLGNRAYYDDAMKMLDSYIKGTLTEEGAKTQAAKAFRNDQPENLLYNLGILSSLTKEGQGDKGSDWLNDRIQGKTDAQREAYKEDELARLGRNLNPGERIANYLADSKLSAADKDKAISQYATTGGYNILYESLRAAGMTPETAVKELGKTDNKTGLSTTIMADGSLETLYAGTDKPGTTNDVPALDRKNTEEYVNFVSAMKVFKETGNYAQLDKLVDQYSKLDENTRAVIDAKDSTVKKYQEYRDLGLSTKDYHAVKDAIKEAQSDLDLDANTGSAVKLVGLSKTNLSDSQVQKLVGSESLGISKTGKALMDVLGKHGLNTEEIGMFLYNADFTNGESNGTLTNVEVAAQLAKTPGLTDKQRSQIYEELKPQLSSYYNDWGKYSYQNEISYIARKGLQLGRAS